MALVLRGLVGAMTLGVSVGCGPAPRAAALGGTPPPATAAAPSATPSASSGCATEAFGCVGYAPAPKPARDALDDPAMLERFLTEVCARAHAKDTAWLTAHVAQPLLGNDLVGAQPAPDPGLAAHFEDDPTSVKSTWLCSNLPPNVQSLAADVATPDEVWARLVVGDHPFRARLARTQDGPRLLELDYCLPRPVPIPRGAPPVDVAVNGRVVAERRGSGAAFGAVVGVVEREPACTYEHARHDSISGAFTVHGWKSEHGEARVRVYARTVAPASWVACLEEQIEAEARSLLRGAAFDVDYHLVVGLPRPASDDDVPGVVMGGGVP